MTVENDVEVEVEKREARATEKCWANWELLGCASTPLSKRIQVFRATVEASFFWCAGSWSLTVGQLQRNKGAQSRLLREMLRLKRDSGESMTDLIIRATSTLKPNLETPTSSMNGGMRDVFSYGWSGVDILRASADWIRQGLRFEFFHIGITTQSDMWPTNMTANRITTGIFILGGGNTTCINTWTRSGFGRALIGMVGRHA